MPNARVWYDTSKDVARSGKTTLAELSRVSRHGARAKCSARSFGSIAAPPVDYRFNIPVQWMPGSPVRGAQQRPVEFHSHASTRALVTSVYSAKAATFSGFGARAPLAICYRTRPQVIKAAMSLKQ